MKRWFHFDSKAPLGVFDLFPITLDSCYFVSFLLFSVLLLALFHCARSVYSVSRTNDTLFFKNLIPITLCYIFTEFPPTYSHILVIMLLCCSVVCDTSSA